METEYLHSALNVTRLALSSRKSPSNDSASLVLLLLLAELEMRWSTITNTAGLPTPAEIRALI